MFFVFDISLIPDSGFLVCAFNNEHELKPRTENAVNEKDPKKSSVPAFFYLLLTITKLAAKNVTLCN
jgi:hypothetical protein